MSKNSEPPSKSSLTSSASAAAAATATAADTTLLVSDDIINMVATFASCRDLCVLGQVCRRFSPLPFHEDLWELRALDILPGVPQLRSAMAELSLATCRELVETFTRVGIPGGILGFWQAEPPSLSSLGARQDGGGGGAGSGAGVGVVEGLPLPSPSPSLSAQELELEARGELLRIAAEAGGFVCESIAPDGARRR